MTILIFTKPDSAPFRVCVSGNAWVDLSDDKLRVLEPDETYGENPVAEFNREGLFGWVIENGTAYRDDAEKGII